MWDSYKNNFVSLEPAPAPAPTPAAAPAPTPEPPKPDAKPEDPANQTAEG